MHFSNGRYPMNIIKNPELKGIIGLILVILVIGGLFALSTGRLEQWFPGPRITDKIVFVSGRAGANEIYTMNPDGSDQKQLTKGAKVASAPVISPLGNHIAFVVASGGVSQIFSVNGAGESLERLTTASGAKSVPGYSPDGNKFAFIASGRTFVSDINGENISTVLPTRGEIRASMSSMLERGTVPAYSNYAWNIDSNSLIGVTRDQAGSDMLVHLPKLDGHAETLIGAMKAPGGGQMLVYVGTCGGQPSPMMTIPSGQHARITGIGRAKDKPVFAISVEAGNAGALLTFDASTEKLTPVIATPKLIFGKPAVSPDGSSLVVPIKSENKKIPNCILKLDLGSRRMQPLVNGDFESASYSPKGDAILAQTVGEKRDIVSIDPSSGEVKQLTSDGNSFDAIWSPVSEK